MKKIAINQQNTGGGQRLIRRATTALAVSLTAAATFAALGFSTPVSAGNKFANVKATALCTPASDGVLTVEAGIEVTKTNEDQKPFVGTVTVFLEQHTPGAPGWPRILNSTQTAEVNADFTDGMEGDTATVATFDYPNLDPIVDHICALVDVEANAIRAVVEVEVENANENQRGGQGTLHLARCISFANPCPIF